MTPLSVIPTLLHVHTLFFSDFVAWATSMDVAPPELTRCETDFTSPQRTRLNQAAWPQAECKANHSFKNDLSNLFRLSNCLSDTEADVSIVSSKSAEFTNDELKLSRDQPPEISKKMAVLDVEAPESEKAFKATRVAALDM